jgi:D-alanyl-D-alanine carboxypeptidase
MKLGSPRLSSAARRRWTTAVVAATAGLVVITSCGTSSSSSPATSAPGATPEYASELGPMLAELVESMQVPSAVVVVRSSEFGDATFRFGSRVLGGDEVPATSDHYRIGSITKTMTATVILQLAQEGKLSVDDPISKYVADVPNGENITIKQLLDMRSGLAGYTENPVFQQAVDKDPERIWRPDELLALSFSTPALFPPGTSWQYSNTNYILLGLVMEHVTGQTVPDLFQQRVFDPLGMESTVMPALDDASIPGVYAHGYQFGTAEKTFGPEPALSAEEQQAAADGELLPADWSEANPSIAWTAGSVISTADDLVVWAKALVEGELLEPEMQARRLASIQPIDPDQPGGPAYGSGMIRGSSYYGHGGQIWGYESQVIRDPDTDTTIVALAALSVSPDGRGPASELSHAVRVQLTETATSTTP